MFSVEDRTFRFSVFALEWLLPDHVFRLLAPQFFDEPERIHSELMHSKIIVLLLVSSRLSLLGGEYRCV